MGGQTRLKTYRTLYDSPQVNDCSRQFYDNFHTKKAIASELNKDEETIRKYTTIATAFMPDYAQYCKGGDGRLKQRLKLNDYQRWLIHRISKQFDVCSSDELVKQILKADQLKTDEQQQFTEKAYERYLQQATGN